MKKNTQKQKEDTNKKSNVHDTFAEEASDTEFVPNSIDSESEAADTSSEEEPLTALEKKQREYDELLDRLQRTLAEFDNFRKRSIKEKASMYDDGVRDTAAKLLPVIDNFERALQHDNQKAAGDDSFYKGVEMILKQFNSILDEIGIEAISAKGDSFNPNLHYAVAHIDDDSVGENTVVEEMQKGYKYKEKVIRPSMVKVAN